VYADGHVFGYSGAISAQDMGSTVTNNQTEMLALLMGLSKLPADFAGTVYSDSAVTLGRVFCGWKWKNVPEWLHRMYRTERARLTHWDQIKYVQLDGHPTKAQLVSGVGKRGNKVSEHNVWCDDACRKAGEQFLDRIGASIPTLMEMELVR
jgi:ribonuclease HI